MNIKKKANHFINDRLPRIIKKQKIKINDEKKEFAININDLYENYKFLLTCYDSYKLILSNTKDFILKKDNFNILYQFMERARYNISKLLLDFKNMYLDTEKYDTKIINEYMNKLKIVDKKSKEDMKKENKFSVSDLNKYNNFKGKKKSFRKKLQLNKIKSKIDTHLKISVLKTGLDPFKYKGPQKLKLTEENLINMRINKALGPRTTRSNNSNVKIKLFDINSPLITKLLSYGSKEFKNKVILERIRQKFYQS